MLAVIRIEVANRKEAQQIERGLKEQDVKAFVRIMGIMKDLPSDRTRERVLRFVGDYLEEQDDNDGGEYRGIPSA
jgi:hypothetical protein